MKQLPITAKGHLALCRISMALTAPHRQGLEVALKEAIADDGISDWQIDEALLQSIPYSGFPATVTAFSMLRSLGATGDSTRRAASNDDPFERVYGADTQRVSAELAAGHPQLERWVRDFAYGEVMGGSPLELATLEALAVASLLGQEQLRPLCSHLRGALRSGWPAAELRQLVEVLGETTDIRDQALTFITAEELR